MTRRQMRMARTGRIREQWHGQGQGGKGQWSRRVMMVPQAHTLNPPPSDPLQGGGTLVYFIFYTLPGTIIFWFNIIALPPRVCMRGVIFYVHNSIVPEHIRF